MSQLQVYPIQQCLWESFDAVLFNKALALAKDLAAELNVSPQVLIDALKKEDRGKFMIIPDDNTSYQCQAFVQRGIVQMRCRCPTLVSSQLCSNHLTSNQSITVDLPTVQRIVTPNSMYIMDDSSTVYTLNGDQCGVLKGSTLLIFEEV